MDQRELLQYLLKMQAVQFRGRLQNTAPTDTPEQTSDTSPQIPNTSVQPSAAPPTSPVGAAAERSPAQEKYTASDVLSNIEELDKQLYSLRHSMETLDAEVRGALTEQEEAEWEKAKNEVDAWLGEHRAEKDELSVIDTIETYAEALVPPHRLAERTNTYIEKRLQQLQGTARNESAGTLANLSELHERSQWLNAFVARNNIASDAAWGSLDEARKKQLYGEILTAFDTERRLTEVQTQLDVIGEKTEGGKGVFGELMKVKESAQDSVAKLPQLQLSGSGSETILQRLTQAYQQTKEVLGIEFYTPYQIYQAIMDLKEMIQESRKQTDRLKISKLKRQLGSIISLLPEYEHLEQELAGDDLNKNNEVKKGFMDLLSANNWQPGFEDMFESGRLLDKYYNDKNRTRSILEYAASKGMLYNIQQVQDWKKEKILGRWFLADLVPSDWSEQEIGSYFGNLKYDNEVGEKKQTEVGTQSVQTSNTVAQYVEAFGYALKGKDFWFAKGVVVRAMEKVDRGHMSAALTVTFMRKMEADPSLRQLMPERWADQVGGIGKPLMIGLIKFDRWGLVNWGKQGGTIRSVNRLGNQIADVRAYLIEKDSRLQSDEGKLDELTAKLIACHTVKVGKDAQATYATIFDQRFDRYSNMMGDEEMRDMDVEKTGDDFFIHRSELLRVRPAVVKSILKSDVSGKPQFETKARFFLTHAVLISDELEKALKEAKTPREKNEFALALGNYQSSMREKLDEWFRETLKDRDALQLSEFKLKDQRTPAIVTLIEKGLLSATLLEKTLAEPWTAQNLAVAIAKQCLDPQHRGKLPHDALVVVERMAAKYPDAFKGNLSRRNPRQTDRGSRDDPAGAGASTDQPAVAG